MIPVFFWRSYGPGSQLETAVTLVFYYGLPLSLLWILKSLQACAGSLLQIKSLHTLLQIKSVPSSSKSAVFMPPSLGALLHPWANGAGGWCMGMALGSNATSTFYPVLSSFPRLKASSFLVFHVLFSRIMYWLFLCSFIFFFFRRVAEGNSILGPVLIGMLEVIF
jgi:hypothetical protein